MAAKLEERLRNADDWQPEDIAPHARELDCDRELEGVREILSRGSSADRQLRIFNANRDIVEVVREIADATEVATA